MPATGADFFLVDRIVAQSFAQFAEANVRTLALITWMGFRQWPFPTTRRRAARQIRVESEEEIEAGG